MKKNRYLVFLLCGIGLLAFAIMSLVSNGSLAQDRYLMAWISNALMAIGVTLLYLAFVFLRNDRQETRSSARSAAEQAEKDAKDAQIHRLEVELSEALEEIQKLKQK